MDERKNVEEIFHKALSIDSVAERSGFLDEACANAPEIRSEIESLLRAYRSAESFLEQPPDDVGNFAQAQSEAPTPEDLCITQPPKKNPRANVHTDRDSFSPRHFGDYELLEKIAAGGMGMVYKARQKSLNRIVALKMILAGQFASEDEVQRFYREAEAAAHLDHPGIVPVFDVGCFQGQHYFSMGFVEGQSLAEKLKAGKIHPREAAMYVKKIATAAHFAHEHGIVHRDLKPGNVLLDHNNEPRITDFGLAKRVEADNHLTATGVVMGTPCYIPPEQASGKVDQISAACDIYALGAILYTLVTGRPPFDASSVMETVMQVLEDEPVSPRRRVPSISKDLEAICLKCLEKRPQDRYATASDLASDLQQFLSGEPIKAKNDFARRFRKWTLREPVLAAHIMGILFMMVTILINYLAFGRDNPNGFPVLILNQGILSAWAAVAFLLQKTHNLVKGESLIPFVWAATNPVFLTLALCANEPPRASLYSLYLLLIVTTSFFRRFELVAITTITSLIGYFAIIVLLPETEPIVTPKSYQAVFGASMAVTGVLLGVQALRLRRMSQRDVV